MRTEDLISNLVADCTPVQPLAHPALRALAWFGFALVYLALVIAAIGVRADLSVKLGDWKFILGLAAPLVTSMMAAAGAFCAGCPGRPVWERLAPLPFLAVWLGVLGEGCRSDWLAHGVAGMAIHSDFKCFPWILAISVAPSALIVVMARRGAPIAPTVTTGLAALAATSLAATALRLFHAEDASVMVLVWQFGSVMALTGVEALLGPFLLRWPTRGDLFAKSRQKAKR